MAKAKRSGNASAKGKKSVGKGGSSAKKPKSSSSRSRSAPVRTRAVENDGPGLYTEFRGLTDLLKGSQAASQRLQAGMEEFGKKMMAGPGFRGRFNHTLLAAILQAISINKLDAVVTVIASKGDGHLAILGGFVVNALWKSDHRVVDIRESAIALLSQESGLFELTLGLDNTHGRVVQVSIDAILMESMRRVDEAERGNGNGQSSTDITSPPAAVNRVSPPARAQPSAHPPGQGHPSVDRSPRTI